jgi:class 3 adenylate cyclase
MPVDRGKANLRLGASRSEFDPNAAIGAPSPNAAQYALMRTQSTGRLVSGERVDRRLAAVLAADVAGYSRLMGTDEEGTLARLKAIRNALC